MTTNISNIWNEELLDMYSDHVEVLHYWVWDEPEFEFDYDTVRKEVLRRMREWFNGAWRVQDLIAKFVIIKDKHGNVIWYDSIQDNYTWVVLPNNLGDIEIRKGWNKPNQWEAKDVTGEYDD